MNNKYAKAYTEVLEILSHFSKEEYSRIPKEKIEFYKNNMDTNYEFKINPQIDLFEQDISEEANAIMISLFRDYFATEKQKEKLKILLYQNQNIQEQEKAKKYNPNNLFENKKQQDIKENIATTQYAMIKYKKNIFKDIINKIFSYLKLSKGTK